MPAGGIAPVRSLRTTFSHSTGSFATVVRSASFRTTPPAVADVFTRALWQLAQYLSVVSRRGASVRRGEALGAPAETPVCDAADALHTAQNASAAANRRDANVISL